MSKRIFILAFSLSILFFNGYAQEKPSLQKDKIISDSIENFNKTYESFTGLYDLLTVGGDKMEMFVFIKNGKLCKINKEYYNVARYKPINDSRLLNTKTVGSFMDITKDKKSENYILKVFDSTGLVYTATKKSELNFTDFDKLSFTEKIIYNELNYNKFEYMVPMRDSIKLYTQVYIPKDQSEDLSILFFRTPYGLSYGEDFSLNMSPSIYLSKEKHIFVCQEIRGSYKSEGKYRFIRAYNNQKKSLNEIDESSDAYDAIEWLLKNINKNNGKVGIWGISYPGFLATMGAIASHPSVVVVSPQAPMSDLFLGDDGHFGGALYLAHVFNYIPEMGELSNTQIDNRRFHFSFPTPDGYSFYLKAGSLKGLNDKYLKNKNYLWNEFMDHETYDDYWKSLSVYQHLNDIKPSILVVGGWYDAEDFQGTIETYHQIERKNPSIQNKIVIGPWSHGGWIGFSSSGDRFGAIEFNTKTIEYYKKEIEAPFFNYYLKNKPAPNIPEASVFETGSNKWRSFSTWPLIIQ